MNPIHFTLQRTNLYVIIKDQCPEINQDIATLVTIMVNRSNNNLVQVIQSIT